MRAGTPNPGTMATGLMDQLLEGLRKAGLDIPEPNEPQRADSTNVDANADEQN